jgi:hypothetical protein
VLASLRGPRNAGKTAVLPGGLTWQSLGLPEADAQYLQARKISRMAIGAAFGIPLALLGDDEKTAVYRSIRDAEEIFWRRFATELAWAASVFDSWLTPEFDKTGDRLTIRFDTSAIEALRPALAEQTTLWQSMLNLGVVTPNEARAHFGIGAPTEWGDKPLLTLQVAQQPAQGATPQVVEPTPISEPVDTSEAQPVITAASAVVLPRDLYKHDAVKSFLKGEPLDTLALCGVDLSLAQKTALEIGIRRRYSADQISAGVPEEGFNGLEGVAR